MKWPLIIGENLTMRFVSSGLSIARFGDGEFNLCVGGTCITQPFSVELGERLRYILKSPYPKCLVGIPQQGSGPKAKFWSKYNRPEFIRLFNPDYHYVSSLITRPDSAPWIDTPEYWLTLSNLWIGKDVTLVRGSEKSLTSEMLEGALVVREIRAPARDAFSNYKRLLEAIGTPETCLLCLGPTATVLAHDLSARGVHAIDLGHVGMFLRKHEQGLPMIVTDEDRAHDRRA